MMKHGSLEGDSLLRIILWIVFLFLAGLGIWFLFKRFGIR